MMNLRGNRAARAGGRPWLRLLALVLATGVARTSPVNAAESPAVLDRWLANQTNVTSWTAEFTQVRHLKALTQPLTTPGRLWYEAPDRFRWELGVPAQSIAIRRGDTLLILSPKLRRAEKYSIEAAARGPMKEAMSLLDTGFPRDAADFNRRFELLRLVEEPGAHRFELQPRDARARQLLPFLSLTVQAADLGLAATSIRFADGSELQTLFTNAVRNPKVDPALFDPTPPPDFKLAKP